MKVDPRTAALIREGATTSSLLSAGISMIRDPTWSTSSGAAAWTCLASGVERLLKLTIGLTAESDGQPWPVDQIRNTYGHRISELRPAVDKSLQARLSQATSERYVHELATSVVNDPLLDDLFQCLSEWSAAKGRYRDLDIIGGQTVIDESPVAAWERAERLAAQAQPQLILGGPDHRQVVREIRSRLAASILRWWFLHYRTWAHGVFGAEARHKCSGFDPRSQPTESTFARTVLLGL